MARRDGNDSADDGLGRTLVNPAAGDPPPVDAPAPHDPLLGQILDGRYRIERVLGQGGMGIVYKATHTTLGKPLAVKVLRAEVSRDAHVLARFKQEAQSASAIGNQHIVDITDFGNLPDGCAYIVMELLAGQSLTDVIDQSKLATSRILHIGRQLCDALHAAHQVGIIHRDLKPDNIQLIPRGEDRDFVKVLDFGIAKVAGGTARLTQVGEVFGTPHYMSPEQCAGTQVDHRTDIYALGVILYEMATGHVPFDAESLMGILTKHIYELPTPPHQLTPPKDAPAALSAIIMKALAKQPEDRYPSMAALARDLDALAAGHPTMDSAPADGKAATTPAVDTGPRGLNLELEPAPELPVHNRGGWLLGGLALLLAISGISIIAWSEADSADSAAVDPIAAVPAGDEAEEDVAALAPEPALVEAAPPAAAVDEAAVDVEKTPPAAPPVAAPRPAPSVAPKKAAPVQARIRIMSQPEGVEIYRGSALLGNTPFELAKPTGQQIVELQLRKPGFKNQSVRISSMTARSVTVSLEAESRRVRRPAVRRQVNGRVRRPAEATPTEDTEAGAEVRPRVGGPARRPITEVMDPWQQ